MRAATRYTTIFALLGLALGLPATVNARTKAVKTLTEVGFEGTEEALRFELVADDALSPDDISADAEGTVISFRVDGAKTTRRWVSTRDDLIKRTLLHPSRDGAAVLRVRLNEKVTAQMLRNVMVKAEDGTLTVLLPRSTAIAERWAGAATVAPPKAVLPPTVIEPSGEAEAVTEAPAAVAEPAPTGVAVAPAAPATEAETPLVLDAPAESEPLTSAVAQPSPEGPSLGVTAVSMLFLGVVGLLLWRRTKAQRGAGGAGPMIKPVGTHLLGPKQSLLLVDVAGEMVLLGTTDKGVQMLTKIEPRERPADSPVTPSASAVPAAALGELEEEDEAPGAGFAERLGRAFARVRSATSRPDVSNTDTEREFFARSKQAVREAADEDALAALVDAVDDEQPRVNISRRAPRAAARPAPAAAPAAGTDEMAADLLQKIRRLQSA